MFVRLYKSRKITHPSFVPLGAPASFLDLEDPACGPPSVVVALLAWDQVLFVLVLLIKQYPMNHQIIFTGKSALVKRQITVSSKRNNKKTRAKFTEDNYKT